MSLIARLKAVHEAATSGPWYANPNDLIGGVSIGQEPGDVSGGPLKADIADLLNPGNAELVVLLRNNADSIIEALEQRAGCGCPCHWDEGNDLVNAWRDGYDTADAEITPLLKSAAAERDQLRRVVEAAQAWRVANQRYDELMQWRDWQSIDIEFPDGTYALKEALIEALDALEEKG